MLLDEGAAALSRWDNFYVIVGSSAGALSGLQFVVIALISDARAEASMLEIRAFGTPTIVHFCFALLVSAIMSAPWPALFPAAVSLAICGAAGVGYSITVIRHARRQTGYNPEMEDWIWYTTLPLIAYGALLIAGVLLPAHASSSLFTIAATTLLLLFNGIHNAWDSVTYIAVEHRKRKEGQ